MADATMENQSPAQRVQNRDVSDFAVMLYYQSVTVKKITGDIRTARGMRGLFFLT